MAVEIDVLFYFKLIVLVLGSPGNVLSMCAIQFAKVPATTKIIITILALSDFCFITFDFLNSALIKFVHSTFYDLSNATCKIGVFAGYFFTFVSCFMIAVLTIERTVAITMPLHAKLILTKRNLILGVSLVILCNFAWNCVVAVDAEIITLAGTNNTSFSVCYTTKYWVPLMYIFTIINTAIPLIIVVVGNITMGVFVIFNRRRRAALGGTNLNRGADSKLLVTTLSVSLCFILFATPLSFYYTVGEIFLPDETFFDTQNPYFVLVDCMNITNYGINFYLYMAFTKSFRKVVSLWMGKVKKTILPVKNRSGVEMSANTESTGPEASAVTETG